MTDRIRVIVVGSLGTLLLVGLLIVLYLWADPITGSWGNVSERSEVAVWVAATAVPFGGPLPYIVAIGLLLWAARKYRWPRGRQVAILLPIVFAVTGLGSFAVKIVVGRPRPFTLHQQIAPPANAWKRHLDRRFQSFPSSDVMVAAGLATVLFLLVGHGRGRYALVLFPAYSAAGRILIARHYPSDCLAAMALGAATTWLLWRLQERWLAARAARTDATGPPPGSPRTEARSPDGDA